MTSSVASNLRTRLHQMLNVLEQQEGRWSRTRAVLLQDLDATRLLLGEAGLRPAVYYLVHSSVRMQNIRRLRNQSHRRELTRIWRLLAQEMYHYVARAMRRHNPPLSNET